MWLCRAVIAVLVVLSVASICSGAPDTATFRALGTGSRGLTPFAVLDTDASPVRMIVASSSTTGTLEMTTAATTGTGAVQTFVGCSTAGCGETPAAVFVPGSGTYVVTRRSNAGDTLGIYFCAQGGTSCVSRSSSASGAPGWTPAITVEPGTNNLLIVSVDSATNTPVLTRCPSGAAGACSGVAVDISAGADDNTGLDPTLVVDASNAMLSVFTRDVSRNSTLRLFQCDYTGAGATTLALDAVPGSNVPQKSVNELPRATMDPVSGRAIIVAQPIASGLSYFSVFPNGTLPVYRDLSSGEVGPFIRPTPVVYPGAPRLFVVFEHDNAARRIFAMVRAHLDGSDNVYFNQNGGVTLDRAGNPYAVYDASEDVISVATDNAGSGNTVGQFLQSVHDVPDAPEPPTQLGRGGNDSASLWIELGWTTPFDNGLAVTSYEIRMKDDPSTVASVVLPAPLDYVWVANMSFYTWYPFQVRAFNAKGASAWSEARDMMTTTGPPLRPDAPRFVESTPTTITVGWSIPPDQGGGIGGYRLRVLPGGDIDVGNVLEHTVTALTADTAYTFAVQAYSSNGTSPWSATLTAETETTVISPPDAPPKPTVSQVTATQIRIAWLYPVDNGLPVTTYDVERQPGGTIFSGLAQTYLDASGILPDTLYYYRVRATNNNGTGPYSSFLQVRSGLLNIPPGEPLNTTASMVAARSAQLSWQAPSPNGGYAVDTYDVLQSPPGTVVATVSATQASISNLTPASEYSFYVRGRNLNGTGPYTSPVVVATLADVPAQPEPVSIVAVTPYSIELSWALVETFGSDLVSWELRRAVGGEPEDVTTLSISPDELRYIDENLAPRTLYQYSLRAVNGVGASMYSLIVSVQTDEEPAAPIIPPPPKDNSAVIYAVGGIFGLILVLLLVVLAVLLRRRRIKQRMFIPMPDFGAIRFGKYGTTAMPSATAQHAKMLDRLLPFLFQHPTSAVLNALLQTCDPADADELSRALVFASCAYGREKDVILNACAREVHKALDIGTLFRANSIATKMMQAYSRVVGLPYLWQAVGNAVALWYRDAGGYDDPEADKQDNPSASFLDTRNIELDDTREGGGDTAVNKYLLMAMSQRFLSSILSSVEDCPVGMRRICDFLQSSVLAKFPAAGTVPTRGYLFLRFFCPAISTPDALGLVNNVPSRPIRRQLILVTKVIQNLANGVLFGSKEKFMIPLNEFIESNAEAVEDFCVDVLAHRANPTRPFPAVEDIPTQTVPLSLCILHGYLARAINNKNFRKALKRQAGLSGVQAVSVASVAQSSSYYSSSSSSDSSERAPKPVPLPQRAAPLIPTAAGGAGVGAPATMSSIPDGVELDMVDVGGVPALPVSAAGADDGPELLYRQIVFAIRSLPEPLGKRVLFPPKR